MTKEELLAQDVVDRGAVGKRSLLLLSFPLWGTFFGAALMGLLSKISGPLANVVYFAWMLGLLISPLPILTGKGGTIVGKLLLLAGYVIVAAMVVFFVGWTSICLFLKACH